MMGSAMVSGLNLMKFMILPFIKRWKLDDSSLGALAAHRALQTLMLFVSRTLDSSQQKCCHALASNCSSLRR
eukprot:4097818-Lingulodinium_polyedra.AAC.1